MLALVRGQWQQWLLLAVIVVWVLWLALTVLLPYAQAKRQRRELLQWTDAPGEARPDGGMGQDSAPTCQPPYLGLFEIGLSECPVGMA